MTDGESDLLMPRIKKIKKMRYQRNKKIFIFSFLCPLIGLTEQGASIEVGIPRRDLVQPIRRVKKRTQARSPEPIFGARTLIFGVNVTHWWGIENQNFGGDPMTLPFLRFFNF